MSDNVIPFPSVQRPSAATKPDYMTVNLNDFCGCSGSTYGLTAYGEAMLDDGVCPGDLLIVDTAATARPGELVVLQELGGDYLVRRWQGGRMFGVVFFGVVTHIIRVLRGNGRAA
jgi:Peptidase S24-like